MHIIFQFFWVKWINKRWSVWYYCLTNVWFTLPDSSVPHPLKLADPCPSTVPEQQLRSRVCRLLNVWVILSHFPCFLCFWPVATRYVFIFEWQEMRPVWKHIIQHRQSQSRKILNTPYPKKSGISCIIQKACTFSCLNKTL